MDFQRGLRYLVIFGSLFIFCYQFRVALRHLVSETTVDSTEYISIADLDTPPVVTICPRQPVDEEKLKDLGYDGVSNLMAGNHSMNALVCQ